MVFTIRNPLAYTMAIVVEVIFFTIMIVVVFGVLVVGYFAKRRSGGRNRRMN